MYGGMIDRVHDLLLCGVDPSLVDLSASLTLRDEFYPNDNGHHLDLLDVERLLSVSACSWKPSHHAFLYGSEFKACIASLCLVKVIKCNPQLSL